MGKVIAVCISEKKGTAKINIFTGNFIKDFGLENDAHGGNWHRQVSLISYDKVKEFNDRGAKVDFGAFGENLVVEGIDFKNIPIGTRFVCNSVILELTQIGKECHDRCAIYEKMGDCIMPREGVFAIVLEGGKISVGDSLEIDNIGKK
ncbi:MOSC domain-containing protein [Fusobacterium sp. PH5-44]|uniref:MOSC domain-containing protein n=1 Tax=unclassified Fusobacterium TaxID=2648384 RepID=UPI003D23F13A